MPKDIVEIIVEQIEMAANHINKQQAIGRVKAEKPKQEPPKP